MRLESRSVSVFALHAALLVAMVAGPGMAQPDTLRTLAAQRGIYVGAAVTFPNQNRAEYERVLRTSFNGVVAENAMKFQSLSSSRGNYNFGPADAIANFADSNGMKLRGHTLVWHSQSANWFNSLSGAAASRDTTLKIMRLHIDTVAKRYKGRVHEWDVVNEAIAQNGGTSPNYRTSSDSRWHNRIGPDYLDSAFTWTQQADSGALLFYNDFGAEFMSSKGQNVYDLVKRLKDAGIPIHGVGLQCHFDVAGNAIDTASLSQNMRRLAALGVVVSMTEIDIQHGSSGTPNEQQLQTQKTKFKALMKTCLSIPACRSYYVWGLNDNQSWRTPQASRAPLLFTGTTSITPKPAYWGVVEALEEGSTQTSTPSAPWNVLAAPGVTAGSVVVSWNVPVTDGRSAITGYKVTAFNDTTVGCTTAGARACTVSGLRTDTTYRFVVRAINAIGTSGFSPPSTASSTPASLAPGATGKLAVGRFTRDYAFVLPEGVAAQAGHLAMTILDASGRVVWERSVRPAASGVREIAWDGRALGARAPSGMYIARVRVTGIDGTVQEAHHRYMKLRD